MSRIGRLPIAIPAGVEVKIEEGNKVTVKGPKGTLEKCLPVEMTIKQEDNQVVVTRPNDLKKMKSLHGLTRSLIANTITGVSEGYEKKLEINGVGYRAQKKGKEITFNLGFSHPVVMTDPEGIETEIRENLFLCFFCWEQASTDPFADITGIILQCLCKAGIFYTGDTY